MLVLGKDVWLEKKQIIHRLPSLFVCRILTDFNAGILSAALAAKHLGIGKSRLYQLRTDFLTQKKTYLPKASGGRRSNAWPAQIHTFLEDFLPLQNPPNYQLVADEMLRLFGFKRARSCVEAHLKKHLAHLVPCLPPKKRVYRRFRRARIGELFQHDSSIHQWWPAFAKQILLLTVDDHSGLNLAGTFVEAETTWHHFCHFRRLFQAYGLPEAVYTDGLSLFGPSSSDDGGDPKSQFQRAFLGLGVAHLVAPTPQAKGKIERRFGTFQKRLVTLLAHARAQTWPQADAVLQMEIKRQNTTRQRTTGFIPSEVWENACLQNKTSLRPAPPASLLDLHLSLRTLRRVNHDLTIDFQGHNYPIAPTSRKSVTIIHHPNQKFWAVTHPPLNFWPPILGSFSL